jgi:hypothetical protein
MDTQFYYDLLSSAGLVSSVICGTLVVLYVAFSDLLPTKGLLAPFISNVVRSKVVKRFEGAGLVIGKHIIVHDDQVFWEWAKGGSLGFGESYMAKMWDAGCIPIDLVVTKLLQLSPEKKREFKPWNWRLMNAWYKVFNMQSLARADIIAKKHYNLGNDFFKSVFPDVCGGRLLTKLRVLWATHIDTEKHSG